MKTFTGKLANGDEYMGVEVPNGARNFTIMPDLSGLSSLCWDTDFGVTCHRIDRGRYEILGTYSTAGEIDLIDKKWDGYPIHEIAKEELCKIFDRDSKKAYPIDEERYKAMMPHRTQHCWMPCGEPEDQCTCQVEVNRIQKWRESESQVRPKHWLIILKT